MFIFSNILNGHVNQGSHSFLKCIKIKPQLFLKLHNILLNNKSLDLLD